jgi:hypothetical protein
VCREREDLWRAGRTNKSSKELRVKGRKYTNTRTRKEVRREKKNIDGEAAVKDIGKKDGRENKREVWK